MEYWPYETGIPFPLREKRVLFPEEFLDNHSLVLGKTGTGKSNLLVHLIQMYEESGKKVIVFDPHGELWKYGRDGSSVITLSPMQEDKVGYLKFNMMSILPYHNEREKLISEDLMIQTLKDVFSVEEAFSIGTWGPRIELIFSIIPRLLTKYKINPTIQDIADLLLNYYKRKDFSSSLEPDEKTEFFSIFNQGYDFISSTVNKILPLISSEVARNLFSSREDFYDISKLKNTLYIELSGDYSPYSLTRPFSIMFLYKLWNNILLRRMRDVVIVMDEFQTISPHISKRIVTEGRKFSLWALMATQSFSGLSVILTSALKTNVHNFFLFQQSDEDLRSFSKDGLKLKNPDFHYFNCLVPRTDSFFTGRTRLATQSRDFSIDRQFYSFEDTTSVIQNETVESMDPSYLSHLVSLNLASMMDGKVLLSREYFEKIGSRHKRGSESMFHRYLITRSYFFFKNLGYEVYEGINYDGHRPDLVIVRENEKIPIECEYSDLENKKRMLEKKKFYPRVIFSVFEDSRDQIPENSSVLLIPPIGDSTNPTFLDYQNEIGV